MAERGRYSFRAIVYQHPACAAETRIRSKNCDVTIADSMESRDAFPIPFPCLSALSLLGEEWSDDLGTGTTLANFQSSDNCIDTRASKYCVSVCMYSLSSETPFSPDDLYPLSPTREKGSSKGQYWNAINSLKPYE